VQNTISSLLDDDFVTGVGSGGNNVTGGVFIYFDSSQPTTTSFNAPVNATYYQNGGQAYNATTAPCLADFTQLAVSCLGVIDWGCAYINDVDVSYYDAVNAQWVDVITLNGFVDGVILYREYDLGVTIPYGSAIRLVLNDDNQLAPDDQYIGVGTFIFA